MGSASSTATSAINAPGGAISVNTPSATMLIVIGFVVLAVAFFLLKGKR
jgi:hypothetical protein